MEMLKRARRLLGLGAPPAPAGTDAPEQGDKETKYRRARELGFIVPRTGPTTVALPGVATLRVPEGYDFYDTEIVERIFVPRGEAFPGESLLVAKTAPNRNLALRYASIGLVDDTSIDPAPLLAERQHIEERYALAHPEVVVPRTSGWAQDWEYDGRRRQLDLAFWQCVPPSREPAGCYRVSFILARRGAYQVELRTALPFEEESALAEWLLAGIEVAEGERYEDARFGYSHSGLTLTELGARGLPAHIVREPQ